MTSDDNGDVTLRDGETTDDSHAARNAALLAAHQDELDGEDDDAEDG